MPHPFDPGLQPERVSLSWQRTAMAIAVSTLLYGRLVAEVLAGWVFVPVAAGLILAGIVGFKAMVRYRHHHRTLSSQRTKIADGLLMGVLALCVSLAGVFALAVLFLGRSAS